MKPYFSFALAGLIGMLLIPYLMKYAKQLNMVDQPDERKVHKNPIPRCGGLGFSIAILIAIIIFVPFVQPYNSLLIGGFIILMFGAFDDILNLNYKWKFFGQIAATILIINQGIYLRYLPFFGVDDAPILISYPLTLLFVVGVTNAVNLSDGLDGLAAGIMLITFSAIVVFAVKVDSNELVIISLAAIGGIASFLSFNTHPAIVFMGDAGSQFLGFMAACLCIHLINSQPSINPLLPLFLLGLPILDTLIVMTERISLGLSPFSPDKRHIHHKLMSLGLTHSEVVICIYLLQSLFIFAAFSLGFLNDHIVFGVYAVFCAAILLFFMGVRKTGWKFRDESFRLNSDRRRNYLRRFNCLFKFSRIYIEWAVIVYMVIFIAGLSMSDSWSYQLWGELILAALLALVAAGTKKLQAPLIKLCVMIVAIYSGISENLYNFNSTIVLAVNIFFVVMLFTLCLGAMVTRSDTFKLLTSDILIMLGVFAALLFSPIRLNIDILLKLVCLFYSVEYLFSFLSRTYRLLNFFCVFAGILAISKVLVANTT